MKILSYYIVKQCEGQGTYQSFGHNVSNACTKHLHVCSRRVESINIRQIILSLGIEQGEAHGYTLVEAVNERTKGGMKKDC